MCREVEQLAQVPTIRLWTSWDLNPGTWLVCAGNLTANETARQIASRQLTLTEIRAESSISHWFVLLKKGAITKVKASRSKSMQWR